MRTPKKKDSGYLLLELLVGMVVLLTMVAMAVPNLKLMQTQRLKKDAQTRLTSVWQIVGEDRVCHNMYTGNECAALDAMLPAPVIETAAWTYAYSANADGSWTYTATPKVPGLTVLSISNLGEGQ